MKYLVKKAPGWHGEPSDPIILETDDRNKAAMLAGCRADLGIPGNSNRYSAYAVDEDGDEVERIDCFRCDECGELSTDDPVGAMNGRILDCPQSVESHLVCWLCDDCADEYGE